ncbi:hypothetical protein NDU88_000220 [Pleurodeles waltl]|uniref:Uncharacterized protein n=1 Tax=Pleurodeles waltl TaxID=8319 RepID=A0AAV7V6Y2_PLEWA|nr:hypothetical protein NDU88_000220 [Pleurodeles waltl]
MSGNPEGGLLTGSEGFEKPSTRSAEFSDRKRDMRHSGDRASPHHALRRNAYHAKVKMVRNAKTFLASKAKYARNFRAKDVPKSRAELLRALCFAASKTIRRGRNRRFLLSGSGQRLVKHCGPQRSPFSTAGVASRGALVTAVCCRVEAPPPRTAPGAPARPSSPSDFLGLELGSQIKLLTDVLWRKR